MGVGTDEFEVLTDILNRMSVYRIALVCAENAEGPKDTVEVNVEWVDRRNEPVDVTQNWKKTSESIRNILIPHVVNCISDKNSTNKYPSKIFWSVKIQI